MINIAMVGYSEFPYSGGQGDLIDWVPEQLEGLEGLHFCYVKGMDNSKQPINILVKEMLMRNPKILHYANYRDNYTGTSFDKDFLREVKRQNPNLPILLTSGLPEIREVASKLGINYKVGVFNLLDYIEKVKALTNKN